MTAAKVDWLRTLVDYHLAEAEQATRALEALSGPDRTEGGRPGPESTTRTP